MSSAICKTPLVALNNTSKKAFLRGDSMACLGKFLVIFTVYMAGCCLSNPTDCTKSMVGQTTPRLSGLCSNDFGGESLLAPRHKPHTHSPLPHLQGDDNSTTVQQ